MIDGDCTIWRAEAGFCWTSSEAWGLTDDELCGKCKAKTRTPEQRLIKPSKMPQGVVLLGPSVIVEAPPLPDRTCRFCGQTNVYHKSWRKTAKMCSKSACWKLFLAELRERKLG